MTAVCRTIKAATMRPPGYRGLWAFDRGCPGSWPISCARRISKFKKGLRKKNPGPLGAYQNSRSGEIVLYREEEKRRRA